jgi:hypothetical protein
MHNFFPNKKKIYYYYSNVAEEKIAKQFPTERREIIFCAIHMTEKWPLFLHMMTEKWPFWFWMYPGDNIFFSVGNQNVGCVGCGVRSTALVATLDTYDFI